MHQSVLNSLRNTKLVLMTVVPPAATSGEHLVTKSVVMSHSYPDRSSYR